MKLNTTDFPRKCQHPVLLALAGVPLAMLIVLHAAPEVFARMWLIPAAYVLLAWGCILLPGKVRLIGGVAGAAAILLMGLLLPVSQAWLLLLLPVIYAVLLFVALPIGGWTRNQELSVGFHCTGVVTHVLMQIVINTSSGLGGDKFAAAQQPLIISFLCYAGLVLMALNRASLDSAAMSRRTVPVLMRRQNKVVTFVLMALGVAIAAIPAIGGLLDRLWTLLKQAIVYAAGLLMALLPQQMQGAQGAPGGPASMDMGFAEAAEPSRLAIIMEKALFGIALILLAVGLFFAGRFLIKRLRWLLKLLWARLGSYSAAAGEDYEDEITDTRDEPDTDRQGLFGRFRRYAPENEKNMTPAERVRYRYKLLKRKHADWTQAHTARETLPESAAVLYERARYSGEALSEAEAERFREGTRRV